MITTVLVLAIGMTQIEGQVFVAGVNQAAAYAHIELVRSGRQVAEQYADGHGRFRFSGVAPGRYTVAVRSRGYESLEAEVDLMSDPSTATVLLELRKKPSRSARPTVVGLQQYMIPRNAQKEFERGRNAMQRKQWGKAVEYLERGLRSYSGDAAAHNDLGNSYRNLGRLEPAEQSFKRAIELNVSPYPSLNLAEVYVVQRRFDSAESVMLVAIGKFPNQGDAYYGLAHVYFVQELFDKAESLAVQALARPHRIADVHLLLAKIYDRTGNQSAMVRQLEEYRKER
jgi:Flp pilus assembly protein TadD